MHASHRTEGSSSAVRKTTRAKANSDLVHEPDADAPLQLDIFEQARRQIAEAKTVEPVNDIIALATGLAAAARKATNRDLEVKAEVLKMEAKRKLGQLMAAQKEAVGFNKGGRPKTGVSKTPVSEKLATLAEAGIDKNLAKEARAAAAMSEEQFKAAAKAKRDAIQKRIARRLRQPEPLPSRVDRCVAAVTKTLRSTIREMQRGHAPREKFDHLRAALHHTIDALTDTISDSKDTATAAARRTDADDDRPRCFRGPRSINKSRHAGCAP
jgi:hypothetical protein